MRSVRGSIPRLGTVVAIVALALAAGVAAAQEKPNILVIFGDDAAHRIFRGMLP
jgi:hypothetical protein